jgi:hypothetical protein
MSTTSSNDTATAEDIEKRTTGHDAALKISDGTARSASQDTVLASQDETDILTANVNAGTVTRLTERSLVSNTSMSKKKKKKGTATNPALPGRLTRN